jgi:hypothetical protein
MRKENSEVKNQLENCVTKRNDEIKNLWKFKRKNAIMDKNSDKLSFSFIRVSFADFFT